MHTRESPQNLTLFFFFVLPLLDQCLFLLFDFYVRMLIIILLLFVTLEYLLLVVRVTHRMTAGHLQNSIAKSKCDH